MKSGIFEKKNPSFEEIMYWHNRGSEIDYIYEKLQGTLDIAFEDLDAFYDSFPAEICWRCLFLINHYNHKTKSLPYFHQILKLNHFMHTYREYNIFRESQELLEEIVTPEHEFLLLKEWSLSLKDYYRGYEREVIGCFPYTDLMTKLLLKIGCKNHRILQYAQDILKENYYYRVVELETYYLKNERDPIGSYEYFMTDLIPELGEDFKLKDFHFLSF